MALTPTTDIKRTLRTTLQVREGVGAGVTWRDFMLAMTRLGVKPDDWVASIEYGVAQGGTNVLTRDEDEHGGIEIREKR